MQPRGTWVAQSVECPTLGSGLDLTVMSLSPVLGDVLDVQFSKKQNKTKQKNYFFFQKKNYLAKIYYSFNSTEFVLPFFLIKILFIYS